MCERSEAVASAAERRHRTHLCVRDVHTLLLSLNKKTVRMCVEAWVEIAEDDEEEEADGGVDGNASCGEGTTPSPRSPRFCCSWWTDEGGAEYKKQLLPSAQSSLLGSLVQGDDDDDEGDAYAGSQQSTAAGTESGAPRAAEASGWQCVSNRSDSECDRKPTVVCTCCRRDAPARSA